MNCGCSDQTETESATADLVQVRVLSRGALPVEKVDRTDVPEVRNAANALSGSIEQFRVTRIARELRQNVIVSKDDPRPTRHSVRREGVEIAYFQEGMDIGPIKVLKADAATRTIECEVKGKVSSIDLGPAGIQTNCWVEIVSTGKPMTAYVLRLGDRLGADWTLKSVQPDSAVFVNQAGIEHTIQKQQK